MPWDPPPLSTNPPISERFFHNPPLCPNFKNKKSPTSPPPPSPPPANFSGEETM